MKFKKVLSIALLILVVFTCMPSHAGHRARHKLNVMLIVIDDMGFNDIGYNNPQILTPNMDSLAAGGVRLDRNYTCPVCVPTRMGLYTGRLAHTLGWPTRNDGSNGRPALTRQSNTIAEIMRDEGYANRALFGKWHLGFEVGDQPLDRGFTQFEGMLYGSADYFTGFLYGTGHNWFDGRDEAPVPFGYTTDAIAEGVMKFISDTPNGWLCVVSFNAPHQPIHTPPVSPDGVDYTALYDGIQTPEKPKRHQFAAMISYMDERIGDIVDALKTRGRFGNTLIYVMSDNGGHLVHSADNSPLLGEKNTTLEGGIRAPAFVHWKDGFSPTDILAMTTYVDFVPTVMTAIGADMTGLGLQGRSIQETLLLGDVGRTYSYWTTLNLEGVKGFETVEICGKDKTIQRWPDGTGGRDKFELDPFTNLIAESFYNGPLDVWAN